MTCEDLRAAIAVPPEQTTVATLAAIIGHLRRCPKCDALVAAALRRRHPQGWRMDEEADALCQELAARIAKDPEARQVAIGGR